MAEALAVVGVVSNIVGLIDFASKLYSRLKNTLADANEVPKSFRSVKTELPVLIKTLEDIEKAFREGKLNEETAKVVALAVRGCEASIRELERSLAGVLLDPEDRSSKKLWKTFMGVVKENEINNIVGAIRGSVETLTFHLVAKALSLQPPTDKKLVDIRRWLLAPDPTVNYQKALLERQANTGQWFLESSLYQDWKGTRSAVWLHGIPGCGKTILSTTIIENIQKHVAEDPDKALAYFYFDFKDQQKQGIESLVRSLMYQLCQQFVSIPMALEELYDSCKHTNAQPHSSALLAVLRPAIRVFSHTFIVIDALDECTQREDLMKTMKEIFRWQIDGLHVLVTSRREGDIENTIGQILEKRSILSIQTEAVTRDIQLYIHKRLSYDDRLRKWQKDAALYQEIEASLLRNACGMFRWAVCQLDFLRDCRNRRQLLQALNNLPPTLDATYDRIFGAICESDQPYALRILRWLTFATRPLYLQEVAEIAAMDPDRVSIFDREEVLEDPSDVLSICSSLVVLSEEEQSQDDETLEQKAQQISMVQLAHYSVKEYLVSRRIQNGPAALYGLEFKLCNTQIAKCCLQYLLQFETLDISPGSSLQEFSLKSYSAKNWAIHVRDGLQNDQTIKEFCFDLLTTHKKAYAFWHKLYKCEQKYVVSVHEIERTDPPPQLYFASRFGLTNVVEHMLENGEDPDVECYKPPLQAAARNGHIPTAQALIQQGADVKMIGGNGIHALFAALSRGQVDMARFLIERGADVKAPCEWHGPPIHAAIRGGINAVRLLLENDCDLYDMGGGLFRYRRNALQSCAMYGDPNIAKALVEHGAQINGTQGSHKSALHFASGHGKSDMVKFLLTYGADIHEQDEEGNMAIHEALACGYTDIAKPLVERETAHNSDSPCFNFDRALINAIRYGNIDTTVFMLENGADANATSFNRRSPIHQAFIENRFDIVKLLITHGVDINARVPSMRTSPFLFTIRDGDLERIKFLIDNGADPNGRGEFRGLPLLVASQGHYDVVYLLIEQGADVTWYHKEVGSALQRACGEGQLEIVKLLVSKGAPINYGAFENIHPLQSAAKYGHLDVAKYLLENGADINTKIAGLHTAVSMGNMEMTALLLGHLPVENIPDLYFGKALTRAVWSQPVSLYDLYHDKGGSEYYKKHETPADIGCSAWNWTTSVDMVQFLIEKRGNVNALDQISTTLIQAVRAGKYDVAKLLLEKGADPNARDICGIGFLTALQTRYGLDVAESLVEHGAPVNELDGQSYTLLEKASLQGDLEIVKALIEKGADVEDSSGRFGSALIAASCSFQDNTKIYNVLLQSGAKIDTQHPLFGSALSAAAKRGHLQIVRLLLESGASVSNLVEAHSDALRAALQSSCEKAQQPSVKHFCWLKSKIVRIIELLVNRGAKFGSDSDMVNFVLQAAMSNDLDVMKILSHGSHNSRVFNDGIFNVILWIASCRGQLDMIHLLFSIERNLEPQGCEVGQIEQYSLALKKALSQRYFDIASFLIEKGGNAHLSQSQWKRYLRIASANGNFRVLKFLVEKEPNPEQAAKLYSEALIAASGSGHCDVVDFLIGKGADVNASSRQSGTALSAASSGSHFEIVELLISKGADVNARSGKFGTALLAASAQSDRTIVRFLISNGADINATNEKFGSALIVATCRKDRKLMGLLLRRGADINARGGKYGNALQAALAERYYHIARVLIRDGADINAQGGLYGNALQATLSVSSTFRSHCITTSDIINDQQCRDMAMFLIENGADHMAQGGEYGSALLAALSNGHYHIFEILTQKDASSDAHAGVSDNEPTRAPSNACGRHLELDRKLAKIGIDDNAVNAALLGGFPDIARKFLLQRKSSFAASVTKSHDFMRLAVQLGYIGIATMLLDQIGELTPLNDQLNDIFLLAIKCRRDSFAKSLIDRGANVDARDEGGYSGLQLAVLSLNFFMVKALVKKNADINACSMEHGTVLHTAILLSTTSSDTAVSWASFFRIELLDYFLKQGADLNIQGCRYGNALQAAIENDEDRNDDKKGDTVPDVVGMLIEKGADINAQGGEYGNALQAALALGKPGIARFLICKGADIHILGGIHGNMVQAALFGGCHDLAEVLIRQGVDVNANDGFEKAIYTALSKGCDTIVDLLLEDRKDFKLTGEELDELLQEAVLEGDIDSVKACTHLIVRCDEPTGRQRKLNDAVAAALGHGHHDIFEFLLEKGARIDLEAFQRCVEV